MSISRRWLLVAAVGAAQFGGVHVVTAEETIPTDCRADFHGTLQDPPSDPGVERFDGAVRPDDRADEPRLGTGPVVVRLTDGREFVLRASTFLCRRDGGLVPEHGGANIADVTGSGFLTGRAVPQPVTFKIHVEDRGAGHELEDYFALDVRDSGGVRIFLDANFLGSGDVRLTPVE